MSEDLRPLLDEGSHASDFVSTSEHMIEGT